MTSIDSQRTLSPAELDALSDLASVEMETGPLPDDFKELALQYARGELTLNDFLDEVTRRYE